MMVAAVSRAPLIVVENDAGRFYVLAEWSRRNRSLLAIEPNRDLALAAAGKAAIQWSARPVVERGRHAQAEADTH